MRTVARFERVDLSDVMPRDPATMQRIVGAVRLVIDGGGEIFALVMLCGEAPYHRAIYWERDSKRFAYHPIDPGTVALLWDTSVASLASQTKLPL